MSAPIVFAYLDIRKFLTDWLEWKSTQHPGYGLGSLAHYGQLSRATLPNVLSGRRQPSPETLDGLAQAMRLDADERAFLGLLADLGRVTNLDEQLRILRSIFEHPRTIADREVAPELLGALTSWCSPIIVELSRMADFQPDPAWIAARIRPEVELTEVEAAFTALAQAGLLGDELPHRIHTPSQVDHLAGRRAHLAALEAASRALIQVPSDEREFHIAVLSVPEASVPAVLAELRASIERIRDLADGYRGQEGAIVQVQMQAWLAGVERE